MEMEIHLGMSLEEANSNGWRGTNQGHILKTTEFWYNSGNGIDSLGFAAAPGGYRHYSYGAYVDAGYNSDYWTSSPATNPNHGIARLLYNNQNGILRGTQNKGNGRSIRCIKSETDICFDPDGDGVCPEDEISGCTDETACNFDAEATHDDESCIPNQEAGSSCDDGDDNTFNDAWDAETCTCAGTPAVAEDGSGPCEGALTVNYHGYDYLLVEIGDQCWFRENCKFLPTVSPGDVGSEDTPGQPHAYVYGYNGTDVEEAKEFAGRYDTYGVLYNHYAAYQWQLCPVGWHEAMSDDWRNLELALGLPDSLLAGGGGSYGTDIGTQIKSNELWDGTNSSGFTLLGSGYREVSGNFHSLNYSGHYRGFSPSQPIPPNFHGLVTQSGWTGVDRAYTFVNKGFAVRCVKSDEEFCFDPDGNGICANNEVFGCTDETACNYNAEATHDDGSCIPSQEAGSSCDDGDDNTFNDAWDAESCMCAGTPAVAEDGSGPCEGVGTVTYHGYEYLLVEIGEQCWFRENLQTIQFLNGDSIPSSFVNSYSGHGALAAATAAGPMVAAFASNESNLAYFGGLYNHAAVTDSRGLCPAGWHVPHDDEWAQLTIELGMPEAEAYNTNWTGSGALIGPQLRNNDFYLGSNSSGFSALHGGNFASNGHYYSFGEMATFWSSEASGGGAWLRALGNHNGIQRQLSNVLNGLSVRCLKDVSPVSPEEGAACDDGNNNTYNDVWDLNATSCAGTPAVAEDGSGPCEGALTVNYNGYDYLLVEIGEQCWFRENLQTIQFLNGDSIPSSFVNSYSGHGALAAATAAGPMVAAFASNESNLAYFGGLYNHAAVTDSRGLCPAGWHVPHDDEWAQLTIELGMPEAEAYNTNWTGSGALIGPQLRNNDFYLGSNSSGFSALHGGNFASNGQYYSFGEMATFWSSEASGGGAWLRALGNHNGIQRQLSNVLNGLSVRCLKDVSPVSPEEGAACDDGNNNTYNDVWDLNATSCAGTPAVAEDGSGPCEGALTVNYNGYDYLLVEIGEQCWFRENLQTIQFLNGDSIPSSFVNSYSGHGALAAATAAGPMVAAFASNESNLAYFGGLYNHAAVTDSRGLCPAGWHVPHDDEWAQLTIELGMPEAEAYNTNWTGSGALIGPQLRNNDFYLGSNSSGFSALHGGNFASNGQYYSFGEMATFWSSEASGGGAWLRALGNHNGIQRQLSNVLNGLSVRCLKDVSPVSPEEGAACDDGNNNTYNDVWDLNATSCAGTPAVAEDGSGPCEGALTVNYNGYDYLLVEIGEQCWFRENLRTENYTNGDSIPSGLSNSEWSTASFGASAIYGENPSNLETFGRLYNWLAVNDSRGLCPSGWHVPADSEWMVLEMTLGMSDSLVGLTGWRGTDQGTQIKSTYSWNNGGNGTNTSGFNAPAGGSRYSYNGGYYHAGDLGEWWSSSEDGTQGWFRTLSKEKENIRRNLAFKGFGFSVRCIVDDADTCFDPDGDGVCPEDEISGCTDVTACNYDPEVTDEDGSCTYPASLCCDCDGNDLVDSDGDGNCQCVVSEIPGCTDASACNFNSEATDEDGSCTYPGVQECSGCPLDCDGNLLDDTDGDGVCDTSTCAGCTDESALNYDPLAVDDDGSCVY